MKLLRKNLELKFRIVHKRAVPNSNLFVCKDTTMMKWEKITDDWNEVSCKNCLKLKDIFIALGPFELAEKRIGGLKKSLDDGNQAENGNDG
jgi:hypothetical protein